MRKYIILAAIIAFGVYSGAIYWKGRHDVAESFRIAQLEGRIKVIQTVTAADSEADNADADGLCDLLGGCDLPND